MTDFEFSKILKETMPEYRVVERIGAGNYGSVFKCERDGIFYAIKIISVPANEYELQTLYSNPDADKDEVNKYLKEKVEGYQNEIMLMSALKGNRSIVNIEDYKTFHADTGFWYIAIRMELLTSLPKYTSKSQMSENEVIRLGIDICDALIVCERHNIIHRDIKPENIMRHGEGAFKLGDFGVAKQLSKTTTGTVAGTEGFMAPEVHRGGEYNQTADIYSLGIVLYYYLNNKRMPYVDPNNKSISAGQQAILRRMVEESPLPPPPMANESLGNIIVKATMYDKECRYRSAADMRDDLIRVLNGQDVNIDFGPSTFSGTIVQTGRKNTKPKKTETPFGNDMIVTPKSLKTNSENKVKSSEKTKNQSKGKKTNKLIISIVAALCCLAVIIIGGIVLYQKFFSAPEPGTYIGEDGELIVVLSKEEMEEAYNKGIDYSEQGKYDEAIAEFNKVTKYSNKYKDAQNAIEKTKEDYKNSIISNATNYLTSKDYDKALNEIDMGIAALGENEAFEKAKSDVFATIKADSIASASDHEKGGNLDAALSSINYALSYLPDDYELAGLYSRINTTNISKKALDRAAGFKATAEYAKLFSTLNNAMNEVKSNTSATAELKLAYDTYMAEYLDLIKTETIGLETPEQYANAVKLLEGAVEIFPDNYDLKTRLTETRDASLALNSVKDAEKFVSENNYASAFEVLKNALDSISGPGSNKDKVQAKYDEYAKIYVADVLKKVGKPSTISEYEKAIDVLDDAVLALPGNSELNGKLSTLKANMPVDLFSRTIVLAQAFNESNSFGTGDYFKTKQYNGTDNYNNFYEEYTYISTYSGNRYHDSTQIVYDTEGYKKLSGTVALNSDSKNTTVTHTFEIYGSEDGESYAKLASKDFTSGTRPWKFSVDISKYKVVKIRMYKYNSYNYASLILSDFTLTK